MAALLFAALLGGAAALQLQSMGIQDCGEVPENQLGKNAGGYASSIVDCVCANEAVKMPCRAWTGQFKCFSFQLVNNKCYGLAKQDRQKKLDELCVNPDTTATDIWNNAFTPDEQKAWNTNVKPQASTSVAAAQKAEDMARAMGADGGKDSITFDKDLNKAAKGGEGTGDSDEVKRLTPDGSVAFNTLMEPATGERQGMFPVEFMCAFLRQIDDDCGQQNAMTCNGSYGAVKN